MNAQGRLSVDEFLQVKDVPDVYAIGDCNDVPEIKLAIGAETQGKYVADQLKLKHEGKAMTPYNVNSTLLLITFLWHQHYIICTSYEEEVIVYNHSVSFARNI